MFPLRLAWKKISAERAALTCRRPDGSVTWSRVGDFFPKHDLIHFAVETTLGIHQGFLGLVAGGWALEDFRAPGLAARLPVEAHRAEVIVGTVMGVGATATHAEFTASLEAACTGQGLPPANTKVTAEQLAEIQRRCSALHARWDALPAGDTLELEFTPGATAPTGSPP